MLYLLGMECLQTGLFFICQPVCLRLQTAVLSNTCIVLDWCTSRRANISILPIVGTDPVCFTLRPSRGNAAVQTDDMPR